MALRDRERQVLVPQDRPVRFRRLVEKQTAHCEVVLPKDGRQRTSQRRGTHKAANIWQVQQIARAKSPAATFRARQISIFKRIDQAGDFTISRDSGDDRKAIPLQRFQHQILRYTQTRAGGMLAQTSAARVTVKPAGGTTGAWVP